MKGKICFLFIIISCLFCLTPNKIFADENMQLRLSCSNNSNQNDNVTCDVIANTNNKNIDTISFRYVADTTIKYSSFSNNVGTSNVSGSTIKISGAGLTGNNVKIGTIYFRSTGGSSGNKTIKLQGINYTDSEGTYYTHSQISTTVYIALSNNKDITSINISSGILSPSFNKNTYNYTVNNYKEDSIDISVTHTGSSISGDGKHSLNLGSNLIKLVVTAQDGSTKTYKITVNRVDNRNSDTTLANIKLSSGQIDFKPNKREYDIYVSSSKVDIDVEKNISSQKIEYSPDQSVTLFDDENKTVSIKVTAEDGSNNTYKLNFRKIESADPSLNIKSLKINGNDFELEDDKTSYNMSVSNSVEALEFEYELEDSDSTVEITGNDKLDEGSNEVIFTIKNKKNEEKKYTFWVERLADVKILENDSEKIIIELEGNKDELLVQMYEEDDNKIIYKDVLNKLSKTDKTLTYEVLNKNDGVEYSIILKDIEDIEYNDDIDINLEFSYTNGDIKSLLNKNSFIYIKNTSAVLPMGSKIKIFVGDIYSNDTKLYLYRYVDKTMENLGLTSKVKKGYVTFEVEDLKNLVITNYDITNKAKVTDKIQNKVTNKPNKLFVSISLAVEFIIILGLVIYAVINNRRFKKRQFEKLDI